MLTITLFSVFLFGLIVGSFLNALDYSLNEKKPISRKHSECPHCKHELGPLDLVPLLSFAFLRGRCRYCRKRISFQYPLVELVTALSYVLVYWHFFGFRDFYAISWDPAFLPSFLGAFFWFVFAAILMLIVISDIREMIILDEIVYAGIAVAFVYALALPFAFPGPVDWPSLGLNLLAGFIGSGFFYLLILVSKGEWMGGGDVKLAVMMGWIVGWPGIFLALGSSFVLGSVVGLGIIALGKKHMADAIPFGPFLVAGTFIGLVFGAIVTQWYLGYSYFLY